MRIWRLDVTPLSQLWMDTGLAEGLVLLLALAMLFQQLRIRGLRSARLELLKQAEVLRAERRELLGQRTELQAALRAECSHVAQLERKVHLLEAAIKDQALQMTGRGE